MSLRSQFRFQFMIAAPSIFVFEILVAARAIVGILTDEVGRVGWIRMWLAFLVVGQLTFHAGRVLAREPLRRRNLIFFR